MGGLALAGDDEPQKQHELQTAGATSSAQHEIQSAIIIAKKMPRNENQCFQSLMKAAGRPSFAEDATYSFPRGDKDVTGPSVNLAREAARVWGNIRFGLSVLRDDDESRLIRGWAWDVETNTKVEVEDDFKKLIQRRVKGSNPPRTEWLVPDERDLRELTNRRGAILVRNAILQVIPKDLIEDALFACGQTLTKEAGKNPEGERKRLLVDFGSINVSVEQIEQKLGHPFVQSTPAELAQLRGICKSIQDGHTSWAEYMKSAEAKAAEPKGPTAEEKALAEGQERLKQQRENPTGLNTADTLARSDDAQDTAELGERGRSEKAHTITYKDACERLNLAESVKELAQVMNATLEAEFTPKERQDVLATRDAAMKRLAPKKK